MKISKSKRQLAQLIIEAGVTQFPEGAKWAAQNKSDASVYCYKNKPHRLANWESWHHEGGVVANGVLQVNTLINNWHQTVLSRAEFDQVVAETMQDADGWIEWNGGECPVGEGVQLDYKLRCGLVCCDGDLAETVGWGPDYGDFDIIAYRLHKPPQPIEEICEKVTEDNKHEHVDAKPTLDQLLQDWRNASDYAQRKQAEADEAAKASSGKWEAVQAKAAELGVTIEAGAVKAGAVKAGAPELEITDWRDLKVGDIIWWSGNSGYPSGVHKVSLVEPRDYTGSYTILIDLGGRTDWIDNDEEAWRFIRRP